MRVSASLIARGDSTMYVMHVCMSMGVCVCVQVVAGRTHVIPDNQDTVEVCCVRTLVRPLTDGDT